MTMVRKSLFKNMVLVMRDLSNGGGFRPRLADYSEHRHHQVQASTCD